MKKKRILFFVMFFIGMNLYAQTDSLRIPPDSISKYYDMSLEQLRSIKSSGVSSELETFLNSLITVASQKAFSTRESPSVITLISEEEIKKSGARDLVDVLRLVPGFEFAYDGSNSLGIGVRGNWANEGKVLLQIDGVQMNEIFSGTTQFGNNYPIASISRIEIIRGPGSSIYGGFAELGVINIITKSAREIKGAYVSGTYGQMKGGNANRIINIGAGAKIKDFDLSVTGAFGQGNRSDRDAFVNSKTFNYSGIASMASNSATDPFLWNVKAGYKGVSLKVIYDNYKTDVLNITDPSGKRFLTRYSRSFSGEIEYDWKLSEKLTVTPSIFFTSQSPRIGNLPDTISLVQELGQRFKSSLVANYNPSRKINVILGFSYFKDTGTNDADSISTLDGYVRSISYHNYAVFSQFSARHRIVNLVLGARYESNSEFGDAFVPRIALTKRINRFHSKVLYSSSFRSPTIQNISRGLNISTMEPGIKPERTTMTEVEVGYQLTRNIFATVNVFDSRIKDPIIYSSESNVYTNLEKSGSQGVEVEVRMKKTWGFINANYSFYTVANQERLQIYSTREYAPGDSVLPTGSEVSKTTLLAFPSHKITLNSNVAISKSLSVSPSLIWVSKRYGQDFRNTGTNTYEVYLREDAPKVTSNLYVNWLSPVKGLEVGAGVYNLFNTKYDYMVPIASRTTSPLPSGSREYSVRLSYTLKSK